MRAVGDGLVLRSATAFALVAGIAAVVVALAACSGPRDTSAGAVTAGTVRAGGEVRVVAHRPARVTGSVPPTATASTIASTTASTTTASTTTASTTVAMPLSVPTCGPADLRAAFDVQPHEGTQPGDRTRVLVVVTDLSSEACAVEGFAVVDVVEAGRRHLLALRHVELPGPAAAVVVAGGGSAFAGVEWTTATGCPVVSALRLALPGWGTTLPVGVVVPGGPEQALVVCPAGAVAGPFAATGEGTVAFPDSVGAGT